MIAQQQVLERSLAPLEPWFSLEPEALLEHSGSLELSFDWPRASDDPRELSEIPELRVWSLRADALCPWLPLLLERRTGQLTRHVAMLLPPRLSRNEGIRYAPHPPRPSVPQRPVSPGSRCAGRGALSALRAATGCPFGGGGGRGPGGRGSSPVR